MADYAVRHIYNRGTLSGLNTIHFARWVSLDDNKCTFFSSNYDGSLESYMNDFIDKAAWGLNAIFSNGDGFPPTAYLFCGGITDEKAYKRFLPTRQVPSRVWYGAYQASRRRTSPTTRRFGPGSSPSSIATRPSMAAPLRLGESAADPGVYRPSPQQHPMEQAMSLLPELDDIQGIIVRGYGSLKGAYFVLLRMQDAAATKRWLGELAVRSGASRPTELETCVNIAFTYPGLAKLGLDRRIAGHVLRRVPGGDDGDRAPAANPGGP